jgi:hypothetical protein
LPGISLIYKLISAQRPSHFNLLILDFSLGGVAVKKQEWHKSATIVLTSGVA